MPASNTNPLRGLLADTWWFGLTSRLSAVQFLDLARQRAAEGFNAVQIVVGIPPEVGPLNPNARSEVGFPWSLEGEINHDYLALARARLIQLNEFGLKVIVYGAWGHQMGWVGREKISHWWTSLVAALDDLDVAYCVTGESNLWLGMEGRLLPDRTSGNLAEPRAITRLPGRVQDPLRRLYTRTTSIRHPAKLASRKNDWSYVLAQLAERTDRPLLIHPLPGETAFGVVNNGDLLAANTIQSGHSESTRNLLWQIPLRETHSAPQRPFINLEPWYEGILDRFGARDQLFAYWVSMLAGATGYCYGGHGLWNVGDGEFLGHWGKQTFNDARALDTPRLIGLSHELMSGRIETGEAFVETRGGQLHCIGRRRLDNSQICYFPQFEDAKDVPPGRYWLPLAGQFADRPPRSGPVVVLNGP